MNNDIIDQTIQQYCKIETSWYEGMMELEVIPRIQRQLKLKGIAVDFDAISARINHLNLNKMQEDNPRFLVATFPDGTRYKVPVDVIQRILAEDNATTGDIDLSDAIRQANACADHSLIAYAGSLDWSKVKPSARKVAGSDLTKKKFGWRNAPKVIMRQTEIDRFMTQRKAV